MTDRREFLKSFSLAFGAGLMSTATLALSSDTLNSLEALTSELPNGEMDNEDFWNLVARNYSSSGALLNLNNGGVSPQPKIVQEAFVEYYKMFNQGPSYYMWRILQREVEGVRSKVAQFAGVGADELAFNRNSTEGLDTIINGLNLKKGDEVVISNFDYPNMVQAWRQLEQRIGIVVKEVKLKLPSDNEEDLVNAYSNQISSRTKVVLITHLINWTGQILPAKRIADYARSKGALVIVDAAHSFAQIEFLIPDTGADYLGSSLHKWLCAPFGSGLLYVKQDKIKDLWAGFAPVDPKSDDIRKFENLGTRNRGSDLAVGKALDFHLMIGSRRKMERLHFLKKYWINKASNIKGFELFTPLDPNFSCALSTFNLKGVDGLMNILQRDYNIHTTQIGKENVNGIRVTPHIYTSISDLDRFVDALNDIRKRNPIE